MIGFVCSGIGFHGARIARVCGCTRSGHAASVRRLRNRGVSVRMASLVTSETEKAVKINVSGYELEEFTGDLVVIGLKEQTEGDQYDLPPHVANLNNKLGGAISEILQDNNFKGKKGSTAVARFIGDVCPKRIACYGLGEDTANSKVLRDLGAFAVSTAQASRGVEIVGVHVDEGMNAFQARNITDGAVVGSYSDVRFRKTPEDPPTSPSLELIGPSILDGVEAGRAVGSGVLLAKELVDAPANFVTPTALADTAQKIASDHGLEVEIFDKEKCEEMGMGSFLAVSRASAQPPKFIHLTYKPPTTKKKMVIIGKGLTFDSGGYNLKAGPGSLIEIMKMDMGGSAAALGAAKVISQLKPENVEVHFIIASCENMISSDGMRPGDIIKASNGTTIEVLNTDAEGRLTLADALIFAESIGDVDYIVDLATLTGAVIATFGYDVAGLWSTSDDFAEMLTSSGASQGEKMWRMPLLDEYAEKLKGKISDLKNIGGRVAGSITAALFLREFVKATPWAHIDIAGTGYSVDKGATGWGVRTLVETVDKLSKAE